MKEVYEVLQKLISINTVSHRSTREIADYISNYLD